MVAIIVAVLLLVMPIPAKSTTYYVSTTGSNSNDGLSEDSAKKTIAHCVDLMVAGDTCYVMNGTYNEGLILFTRSGTQAAPIKLLNYPGAAPKIVFTNPNAPANSNTNMMLVQHASGINVAMGWITIEGFEITNGHDGIKYYSLHDSIIRRNWIHDNHFMGIIGAGARLLIDRNIIEHNGNFYLCAHPELTDFDMCNQHHGIYANGSFYTITNNLIYDNLGYGIQQNGSSSSVFNSTKMAGPEYAGADNWIISYNTISYNNYRAGTVVWGSATKNTRIENNIFYQNAQEVSGGQAVTFCGCGSTPLATSGVVIKNNHAYATSPGGTGFISGNATEGVAYTQSGNVVNVSAPAFVDAGSSVPASPDFRLTARAPVNIALATEFANNGIVGAFQPPASPTVASITANKITVNLPMSAAVPVQNLSTAGVSFSCTSNVCPGSPAVSSVSRVPGTDSQIEITLSGITGNACLSHADPVTISYSSSTGTWTGNDNIGPYPGLNQKILSFTSISVTNQCTGSGPPSGTSSHIVYLMENGSGTTVSDTSGNAIHATTSGTWVSGKTGFGIKVTGGTTQQTTIPYGSGIDPTSQSMTWVVPVFVATGTTAASNFIFGTETGTDQRGYIAATLGTWKVGRKNINTISAGASNLAVTEGWNHLCVRWDATTDTVTLYKDGVAGTGGATGSYTSYTLATNFEAPILGTGFPTTVTETIYDDVQIFTSLQDCATLYAAWNAPPPPATGTLTQAAIRFGGVVLDTAGSPIVLGSLSHGISVPKRGGAVILFEIKCNPGTDCDQTAFKFVYTKNGATTWQQVPNTETADGTWMWGVSTEAHLNNNLRSTSLTGACTMQTGVTLMTADQVPSLALAQNTCTVLAYIVRVDGVAGVDYFDYKLITQSGLDLPGGYDEVARIRVVNPMASGVGF